MLTNPLIQSIISITLYIFRMIIPLIAIAVVWKCFTSLKKGRRREEPVVILEDMVTHTSIPVLYWENSIGRSKSCDIVLPDVTASRDHAVLMRRESGWIITDTGSRSGTFVNGEKTKPSLPVLSGDMISIGSTALMLKPSNSFTSKKNRFFMLYQGRAASPFGLLAAVTLVQLLLTAQVCFAGGTFSVLPFIPFGALFVMEWGLYLYSVKGLGRVSFEVETMGFLLSGIGIMLLSGIDVSGTYVQLATMAAGIVIFCILIGFMGNLDRVAKFRTAIGIAAIILFAVNIVLGKEVNGAKNWIHIAGMSIQPSELIKIAFIFVGASTLDKLQTAKNLTQFIIFSAICMGALFIMRDFGTACIFFITFLIIAFMRSGSVRTIALICSVAVLGAFLILKFRPYVASRFLLWGHIWDAANINDAGMQQTRVLTYASSGGLFGLGIGNGSLKNVFAGSSDLVFGMVCEEIGLIMAIVVVISLAMLILFARSDVTRSRSTFYSISACAAAGMLLFQTCLNVFGATDVLPLTGVTLPFISAGGSSMMAVWGLLAFIKASDERTYAARRKS